MITEEDLLLDKWFREIGNVLIAEQQLQNFLLPQLQIGQFIAEIAGRKIIQESLTEINSPSTKNRVTRFFVIKQYFIIRQYNVLHFFL